MRKKAVHVLYLQKGTMGSFLSQLVRNQTLDYVLILEETISART
jgi:hypothetical protein